MSQRHRDAIAIADGACNPLAIANAICRGLNEIRDREQGWSTKDLTDDPAIRLMASQLAYLTGIWGGVVNFARGADFRECYALCQEASKPVEPLASPKDATAAEWAATVHENRRGRPFGRLPARNTVFFFDEVGVSADAIRDIDKAIRG